jgi:hypothetical protein
MRKGPGSVYDKWNISVAICDRYSIAVNQVVVATVKPSKSLTYTLKLTVRGGERYFSIKRFQSLWFLSGFP